MVKNFLAVFLPASLTRVDGHRYQVLNRNNRPVGLFTDDCMLVERLDLPVCVDLPGLTPEVAAKLSHDGSDRLDYICLYTAATKPTANREAARRYFEKLAILARLKVE